MKISCLFKYSFIMIMLIMVLFLVMSLFTYFFSYNKILNLSFSFIAPLCIFIGALLYSRNMKEKGLLRGLEIWAICFVVICILKYCVFQGAEISIAKHIIFMPVSILGGILGVNFK